MNQRFRVACIDVVGSGLAGSWCKWPAKIREEKLSTKMFPTCVNCAKIPLEQNKTYSSQYSHKDDATEMCFRHLHDPSHADAEEYDCGIFLSVFYAMGSCLSPLLQVLSIVVCVLQFALSI